MWFRGNDKGKDVPVSIKVEFDDDQKPITARTDVQHVCATDDRFCLAVFPPGKEPDPTTSSSGDHFVKLQVAGHFGKGQITLKGLTTEAGHFDMYSDYSYPPVTTFADHIVAGNLTNFASTRSAIVIGAYVSTNTWIDITGTRQPNDPNDEEVPGQLWMTRDQGGSAGGPTRDNRQGVDVVAPGENVFATYASHSYWATYKPYLIQDGGGHYGRQGATSGAAPIAVGAIALMLEMKPDLRSDQVRELLRKTAGKDGIAEPIPNEWGSGRIDVRAALDLLCSLYPSPKCAN
jgi:hypothetical protein